MLFHSFRYIVLFLPICACAYFLLAARGYARAAVVWLLGCSFFFYASAGAQVLPPIIASIVVNYLIGLFMVRRPDTKRPCLLLGLAFNIGLLGYFKYSEFFLANASMVFSFDYTSRQMAIPLAISFFTLQQIAFLLDVYEKRAEPGGFISYATFVAFFPKLITGPIVHQKEMMPQFDAPGSMRPNYDNIAVGIAYFAVGLFKKTVIADTFGRLANAGFSVPGHLSAVESALSILSYTFQLYYDFGGYMDMAIGSALLFNITLPINFNSPFLASDIISFWRQWHITLSNFITAYIYVPLVRAWAPFSFAKSLTAIGITMLIAGLWHGAAWTFVAFGGIHGAALILNHIWRRMGRKMPNLLGVALTFCVTAISFCFFRAASMSDAFLMLCGLFGFNGAIPGTWLGGPNTLLLNIKESTLFGGMGSFDMVVGSLLTTGAAIWTFAMPNTHQMFSSFKPTWKTVLLCTLCLCVSFLYMNSFVEKEFLYFDF